MTTSYILVVRNDDTKAISYVTQDARWSADAGEAHNYTDRVQALRMWEHFATNVWKFDGTQRVTVFLRSVG